MYVYACIVCTVRMNELVNACMYVLYVCMYVCIHVLYVCICMYFMHVCMYVCMYVHVLYVQCE